MADMTIAVYRGRKATKQKQIAIDSCLVILATVHLNRCCKSTEDSDFNVKSV